MTFLLQHLLRDAAHRHPEKLAVVCGEERLTYGELDQTTDRLAAALQGQGVARGDRVGVYVNKSVQSVVSILGILKAGAAYVPLDPNAPAARIAYIVRNAGIRCLLTSTKKVEALLQAVEGTPLTSVVLTDAQREVAAAAVPVVPWGRVLAGECTAEAGEVAIETDLAYILYTSGSTGEPKGVMITHRAALTFVDWAVDEFRVGAADRLSNHAPLHFDLSVFDIYAGLKAGATIYPVPEEYSIFPRRLVRFILENRITVWYSVPSILTHMLVHGALGAAPIPDLRLLLFAGEVFPVKYLRELMRHVPGAEFYNLYGPTETNVCTFYEVRPLAPERSRPVPIGRPCANTDVFSLDERGVRVTRPGVEGELCARGSCVALGYWGDPAKTRKSFVNNPLKTEYEEQIYRSGDIVTLDEEGNYHLIGRIDHMIKSRGYRIELGEIEAALYSHPDVKEAVAIAVPDEFISNRIKAFVVLVSPEAVTSLELDKFLAERIPHYMIPETTEFCEQLPKTSTGKIDRRQLGAPR